MDNRYDKHGVPKTDHRKAVFGIFIARGDAERASERLKVDGFNASDISILMPDQHGANTTGFEKATKAPEGATVGTGAGMALGSLLGWLAGAGTLAIPGVGPLIAAGPVLALLAGAGAGAAVGAAAGGLVGLGIPEFEAKRYESYLREGRILMSVHTRTPDQLKRARTILESCGGTDITCTSESKTPPLKKNSPKSAPPLRPVT